MSDTERIAPEARSESEVPAVPEVRQARDAREAREAQEVPAVPEAREEFDAHDAREVPEVYEAPERDGSDGSRSGAAGRSLPGLPGGVGDELTERMEKAVLTFVDAPQGAVEEAETVLATALERAEHAVAGARAAVAQGGTDTEALRLALQRYRTLTSHLLALPTP
ncbi:hypothetical protein [Streptomyces sp. NPDC021020]|uniref:hypothetical protein n=1 Tax=Streptomyces sp. NPDC021020 TaxID=3365109 RepID=UPI0037A3B7C9